MRIRTSTQRLVNGILATEQSGVKTSRHRALDVEYVPCEESIRREKMHPTCARTSFSLLLLSSAALAAASAAVLAPAEPRSSISDGILQRQDSTPRTPPPPLWTPPRPPLTPPSPHPARTSPSASRTLAEAGSRPRSSKRSVRARTPRSGRASPGIPTRPSRRCRGSTACTASGGGTRLRYASGATRARCSRGCSWSGCWMGCWGLWRGANRGGCIR